MSSVTYVEHSGRRHTIDVPEGNSVMQGAVHHMIDGIVAECGGEMVCATCHCYVDAAWIDTVDPPSAQEVKMLECVASERRRGSRLSCQIVVDSALNGLVVYLPKHQ
jgi:2Fe-2S ferredoxin